MRSRTLLFVLFASSYVLSQFFRSANAAIAGDLSRELALTPADLGLMTSLFFAAFAVIQIPLGIALDRWGPRWVVSGLMSLAVVGSLLFAVAPSFWMLGLLAGVVGAIAGAFRGLWAGPYALDVLRLEQMEAGNLLLLMGIGSMLGSSSAGWLADRLGERRVGISLAVLCASCQIVLAAGPSAMLGGLFYLLFGFSTGVIVVAVAQARSLFPGTMIGQVLTLMNLFAFAGTFGLQWVMGMIIGTFPVDAAGRYPLQAYGLALLATGLASWLAFVVYLPLVRARKEAPPVVRQPAK